MATPEHRFLVYELANRKPHHVRRLSSDVIDHDPIKQMSTVIFRHRLQTTQLPPIGIHARQRPGAVSFTPPTYTVWQLLIFAMTTTLLHSRPSLNSSIWTQTRGVARIQSIFLALASTGVRIRSAILRCASSYSATCASLRAQRSEAKEYWPPNVMARALVVLERTPANGQRPAPQLRRPSPAGRPIRD